MTLQVVGRQTKMLRGELERIRAKNPEGLLLPQEVLDESRHPDHPLHQNFEWDDSSAAEKYRLDQARALIRCVILENENGDRAPAYISLFDDRQNDGGGYRATEDVLDSEEFLKSLARTAKIELGGWTKRYQVLTSLVNSVAAAADIPSPAAPGKEKVRRGRVRSK